MSLKNTNKGIAWLYSEVCALLDIWAEQDIQLQLTGRLHNMCVYDKISGKLAELGIDRTGEQCREKIKKLRRDYKTVVDNNYSPAFARKLLGCYDKVHEIFGKCAAVKPSFVIEGIVYNEKLNNMEPSSVKIRDSVTWEENIDSFLEKNDSFNLELSQSDEKSLNIIKINQITSRLEEKRNKKMKMINAQLEKQSILRGKLRRRQDLLQKKFIALEKKKLNKELEREKEKLQTLENLRRKVKTQEIVHFKSLLQMIGEKKGLDIKLN